LIFRETDVYLLVAKAFIVETKKLVMNNVINDQSISKITPPAKFILQLILLLFFLPSISNLYCQQKNADDILKKVSEDVYMLNDMEINVTTGTINIPCKINMSEGLLEVILCTKQGKLHESLLVTEVSPLEFQTALLLLGLDAVNEVPENTALADDETQFLSVETAGDSVELYISMETNEKPNIIPLEKFVYDESNNKELQPSTWLFRGAATHRSGFIMNDLEVTLIATYHDPIALMELNSNSKYNDELFYVNPSLKLIKEQPVTLILKTIK